MIAVNRFGNIKTQKEIGKNAGLILGNDVGNYFYLSCGEETRYQGFFYARGGNYKDEFLIYKVIEEINIFNKAELEEVRNNFFEVERRYRDGLSEKYFLPNGYNSICLETNKKVRANVVLDIRSPYDSRQMGRFYSVEIKKRSALIKFTKRRDWDEDGLGDKREFTLYLAVRTDCENYNGVKKFFSKYYKKDHKRDSYPYDRFVYNALEIEFEKAVFSVARTQKKALEEAEIVFDNFDSLLKKQENEIYGRFNLPEIGDSEIKIAYLCACNAILTLMVENNNRKGVYAGLPWFFQFWNRDEAVSLFQIYKLNNSFAKEIALSQLKTILSDGQTNIKRFSGFNDLQSADALGWLADRILKIIHIQKPSKDFKNSVEEKFERAILRLIKKRTSDGLALNFKSETWMDSLEREGLRIEIQACRLRMYNLLYKLTENKQYEILEREMRRKIRQKFFFDGILFDSPEDKVIRPNVFIAAYLYQNLLSNEEWEICFDKILPKLYLSWGGISSIDKTNQLFVSKDTGENSASYHNGNSWYWLNNLTALVLYRINAHKYSDYINAIMEASTSEILYKGVVGCHGETSSAEKQTSSGCGLQLWSAAMYLEVFDEILDKQSSM